MKTQPFWYRLACLLFRILLLSALAGWKLSTCSQFIYLCQHCVTRTPYALRARSLLLVLGYAGAALCATVFHVLRTNRLGVDIPFTHSPLM